MKVVALLKLDRYEEALKTFQAGGDALKQSASLEYAYASYKCGKLEEATEALTRTASGRGASHLEAQVVWHPIFPSAARTNVDCLVVTALSCRELPTGSRALRTTFEGYDIFRPRD